jgi:hypothetical protein
MIQKQQRPEQKQRNDPQHKQRRGSKLEEKDLLAEIEALQSDLNRLISINAGFEEIYSLSKKLDCRIVRLYRLKSSVNII